MESRRTRAAVLVAVAIAAVALFAVLRGGGSGSQPGTGAGGNGKDAVRTITVHDQKPVGGVQELTYHKGDRVRFRVRSDVAGDAHVHGYELEKHLRAGSSVSFDFPASIEGAFDIELHGLPQEQIGELKVEP